MFINAFKNSLFFDRFFVSSIKKKLKKCFSKLHKQGFFSMKRHDVYLAALAQRNRLRREAEEKSIEQQRKIDRERGFSAYVNGANTRAKSATGPRTQSRVSTASSSKSPEPKKPMTALGTSRATRKSWAESMVQDKGPFFVKDDDSEEEEGIMYSETFDDDEHSGKFEASPSSTPEMQKSSSIESVEERVHTPSSSRELVVPQVRRIACDIFIRFFNTLLVAICVHISLRTTGMDARQQHSLCHYESCFARVLGWEQILFGNSVNRFQSEPRTRRQCFYW